MDFPVNHRYGNFTHPHTASALCTNMIWVLVLPLLCVLLTHVETSRWVYSYGARSCPELDALRSQRNETFRQRELLSPQDQYAKWTKANRKLDQLDDQIAALKGSFVQEQSAKKINFKTAVQICYYLLRFWAGNSAVAFPAPNVFPPVVQKLLFKKDGSLGLFFWTIIVGYVCDVVIVGLKAVWALLHQKKVELSEQQEKEAASKVK